MEAVKSQTPMAIMAARELVSSASSVKILLKPCFHRRQLTLL